ncbi:MAG: cryptochrome/photolyase family protein [Spirochaetales bacterium]
MIHATLVYPNQLAAPSDAVFLKRSRLVYLIEEPLFLTFNHAHRQRLLLHRLSMRSYAGRLETLGFTVRYIDIRTISSTDDVWQRLSEDGVSVIHVADTSDDYLERALTETAPGYGLKRVWYESPMFILPRREAVKRYLDSKRHMARFYRKLRLDRGILVSEDGEPAGGRWSFDEDNRKKLPKRIDLPPDIEVWETGRSPGGRTSTDKVAGDHAAIAEAHSWLDEVPGDHYGDAAVWLPWTRDGAKRALDTFLAERFRDFGPYEDALTIRHTRVFHSTISPLINISLIDPNEVLKAALSFADANDIPMGSLEGFVRQVLGWREFVRAAYEQDGRYMRTRNRLAHSKPLPDSFWTGTTGLPPVDLAIERALRFGYGHHIERLMVVGNLMLLAETDPDKVYRWFMGMYVDAYDWVMVPNVYGMSQFADGGLFATKPYISGSNYLRKMSDYPRGEWEEIWTALYWRFIERHRRLFESNHRLSMMPRMLDKMDTDKREEYMRRAAQFLASWDR